MGISRDADGYLPIAGYGVLGDGRTTALVGVDGRIDWWAIPVLDSPPVCSALLDPDQGGHLRLAPVGPAESSQRYVEGTNVLETVHRTDTGTVRVVDALNTGSAGRLPWTELARRVEAVNGEVEMEWEFAPGDRLGGGRPWVSERGGLPIVEVEDQLMAIVTDRRDGITVDPHRASGRFTVRAGESALLAVVATDDEPLPLPDAEEISARIDRTVAAWRRWSDLLTVPEGEWADSVRRSALALKLLITEASGAIAAAATTSLPESIGGEKNWDYRFSWVRDSSFALDSLLQLGLSEEVHGAVSWLLDAIRNNGGHLEIFYTLGGERPGGCREMDLPGWRDSRPVRIGNTAEDQLQLGVYGDLMDTICRYCGEGHILDQRTARMIADLVDDCCDQWLREDSGIWELNDFRHYTISKIGSWVAVDRAVRLARSGQLPDRHLYRWEDTGRDIRRWVDEHCWSEKKRAYTFYAGTDDLDAAVLLAGRTGFDRSDRLSSTVDAVRAELGQGPLIWRYSGMPKEEGAFVACTFWVVDALARVGRGEEASALMREAVALTNPAGLLSEQIDGDTGEFLGNIPQALSHLALVNAAFTLSGR